MDQTLEEIEKELKNIREFPKESYKDKGKQKISKFEMGTCSKPSNVEELEEKDSPPHQAVMETLSEIEVLKKSLQYFKYQNGYLNNSKDKLTMENMRVREDLEKINARYQYLITTSK